MTPLRHNRNSIYDLTNGDVVRVGNTPYIVKKFARGGMGFVILLGRDDENARSLGASVHGPRLALKSILPDAADENGVLLFRRELTVWSGFRHPNILSLHEILDADADGWVAAMDWCIGSLRDVLDERHRLPLKEATDIIGDIIAGLAYAYEGDKVLHLDLKPENVLYNFDLSRALNTNDDDSLNHSRFMVSDWGIASIKQARLNAIAGMPPSSSAAMRTLNNMGTLLYMAPERFVQGFRSSLASDVFSIGMIYFELLMGFLPFSEERHPVESLVRGEYFSRADTALRRAEIHAGVRSLILRMLSPSLKERPHSYEELREGLTSSYRQSIGVLRRLFT